MCVSYRGAANTNGGWPAGGGSGGSIWIEAGTFAGVTGSLFANGGSAAGGGGSGGRIAVYVSTSYTFSGVMEAVGGFGNYDGIAGPGTIYIEDSSGGAVARKLRVVNRATTLIDRRASLATSPANFSWVFDEIKLTVNGHVELVCHHLISSNISSLINSTFQISDDIFSLINALQSN